MPCYHPLKAWRSRTVNPSGKRSLVFNPELGYVDMPVVLPCGRCIGCRLERSRQWAMRCMHEKRVAKGGSEFLTLTYEDAFLPHGGSLDKRALQLFMKRLRKRFGDGIRFFGCGEYGGTTKRPHYHVLLFNLDLPDKKGILTRGSTRGYPMFTSREIGKVWEFGNHALGEVTFESCAYVARYICDKVTGDMADAHYERMSKYGELVGVEPEFVLMSRRPGIGRGWFEKYGRETYDHDNVIVNGREVRPPRYYDTLQEAIDPAGLKRLKFARLRAVNHSENMPERRKVRERVVTLNMKKKSEL